MWLSRRALLATLLVASATSLAAQGRIGCASGNPVATLGTLDLECVQCTIHTGADRWIEYGAEPTVKRTESGSDGLRAGDVIVSIDGALITTAAGSRQLASPNPDRPSNVMVRRDGKQVLLSITSQLRCPVNVLVRGERVDSVYVGAGTTRDNAGSPARSRDDHVMDDSAHFGVGIGSGRGAFLGTLEPVVPSGWLGFGIECGPCSLRTLGDGRRLWDFSEAPKVAGVEPGSPAALAKIETGDVIRAIDGLVLTSATGARRFSTIRPDQRIRITIERKGKTRVIQMTAGRKVERR